MSDPGARAAGRMGGGINPRMSQEAIDALRAVYEQFALGDFSVYADLPDDYVLVTAPEMPDAGRYRGAAARRWLQAWSRLNV
jgi:hypothetical protein